MFLFTFLPKTNNLNLDYLLPSNTGYFFKELGHAWKVEDSGICENYGNGFPPQHLLFLKGDPSVTDMKIKMDAKGMRSGWLNYQPIDLDVDLKESSNEKHLFELQNINFNKVANGGDEPVEALMLFEDYEDINKIEDQAHIEITAGEKSIGTLNVLTDRELHITIICWSMLFGFFLFSVALVLRKKFEGYLNNISNRWKKRLEEQQDPQVTRKPSADSLRTVN
jgi:hypothetical protein